MCDYIVLHIMQNELMKKASELLHTIPDSEQTSEYATVLSLFDEYLCQMRTNDAETDNGRCEHDMVEDLIDIDPEKSQTIYYCSKCMDTLSIENIYRDISHELKQRRAENRDLFFAKGKLKLHLRNVSLIRSKICIDCSYSKDSDPSVGLGYHFDLNDIKNYSIEDNVLTV